MIIAKNHYSPNDFLTENLLFIEWLFYQKYITIHQITKHIQAIQAHSEAFYCY